MRVIIHSILLFFLVGSLSAQDGLVLRPKLIKDHTYRFVTTTKVVLLVPVHGRRDMEMEHQARLDVSARGGGKKGVKVWALTDKLAVKIQGDGEVLSYDSLDRANKDSVLGKHFRSKVHRRLQLELNSDLAIVSEKEEGPAGAEVPMPGMPQFGPDELKQLVVSLSQGFTKDPVSPDDQWELQGSRIVGDAGVLDFDISYRYAGPTLHEGFACAEITFAGVLSGVAESASFESSTITGRILFDPKESVVRLHEQTIAMTLSIPSTDPEVPPAIIPMQQKVTTRFLHKVPITGR